MILLLLGCALLSLTSLCRGDPPVLLDKEAFQERVAGGNPHFVKFFAPWCGHCKNLAPTWDELSEHFTNSEVTIAKVDCTVETQVCADQEVKGYPTLKLFYEGEVSQYHRSRDIDSLKDFVSTTIKNHERRKEAEVKKKEETEKKEQEKQQIRDEVKRQEEEEEVPAPVVDDSGIVHLTEKNFMNYLVNQPGVHFVKFYAPWCGHCQNLAPTWIELATYFEPEKQVHIIKVDCTQEQALCQTHNVRGYPTLLLFEDGMVVKKYSGSRQLDDLIAFVKRNFHPVGAEVEHQKPEEPKEAQDTGVMELTGESFQDVVAQGTTFVKFFAPWCGHCQRLAPTWQQLAETVHGSTDHHTTIAKVDCTVERDLCSHHGVHGYPTLVLFQDGEKKEEYRQARDLDTLLQFVQEHSN